MTPPTIAYPRANLRYEPFLRTQNRLNRPLRASPMNRQSKIGFGDNLQRPDTTILCSERALWFELTSPTVLHTCPVLNESDLALETLQVTNGRDGDDPIKPRDSHRTPYGHLGRGESPDVA